VEPPGIKDVSVCLARTAFLPSPPRAEFAQIRYDHDYSDERVPEMTSFPIQVRRAA
jgi:hypothetical protein